MKAAPRRGVVSPGALGWLLAGAFFGVASSAAAQGQPAGGQAGGALETVKNVAAKAAPLATKAAPLATKAVQAVRGKGGAPAAGGGAPAGGRAPAGGAPGGGAPAGGAAPAGGQAAAGGNPSLQQRAVDTLRNVAGGVVGGNSAAGNTPAANNAGGGPPMPRPAYPQGGAATPMPASPAARPAVRAGGPPG